jgi:hypothetical protein
MVIRERFSFQALTLTGIDPFCPSELILRVGGMRRVMLSTNR